MQELECVREKLQNKYRVVKTDEDLEWNRAIDLCTNIINAHLSRENDPEIARSSRDNDGWIPVEEDLPPEPPEYVDDYGGMWYVDGEPSNSLYDIVEYDDVAEVEVIGNIFDNPELLKGE